MMTRRIIRTISQGAGLLVAFFVTIYLLDARYRVLPQAIHSALPSHHDGYVITDIVLKTCSSINPLSPCRLDPKTWHRVEKDVFLDAGWVSAAYIHIQRKKEEELAPDDKVVVDVRIGRLDPGTAESDQSTKRWEARTGGIWILKSSKHVDSGSVKAVTSVDILYGADAAEPRPGWTLLQNAIVSTASSTHMARLSIRRGLPPVTKEPLPVRVNKDGKFKIVQVSDLHLSTGLGKCRDVIDDKGPIECDADVKTMEFVEAVLNDEKPDMVVLTGDQVNGETAPDAQSALFKIAEALVSLKIPFATIFGNHDDQDQPLSRLAQMSLLNNLPYSHSRAGPDSIDGIGNYYVEVLAAGQSQHSALTLWFLDSHTYSPQPKKYHGYDWIKSSQIEWFRSTAQSLKAAHSKYSRIHLDMAFLHIPLPEYAIRENIIAGGEWREPPTSPRCNSHFYDALVEQNILTVGAGHDHVNDYCALKPDSEPTSAGNSATSGGGFGPWMCYAGASGFGGYAGYGGYHRRVRVWLADTNTGRITTWTRLECCGSDVKTKHNELMIVDGGKVVSPKA